MRDDGRTTRDIERELEETRARIDQRARELQERLSPGQLLDQALVRARVAGVGDFFTNLGRSARDNPMPLVLTGVGIAWLMASSPAHARDQDEDYDFESRADLDDEPGAAERAGEAARRTGHDLAAAARSGVRRARSAGRGLRRRGRRLGDSARSNAHRVQDGFERLLEDHPLVLGLAGLAFGALLGASVPPTETEDEWLGERSDELKARASKKVRDQAEHLRENVEERSERSASGSSAGKSTGGASSGSTSSAPSSSMSARSSGTRSESDSPQYPL